LLHHKGIQGKTDNPALQKNGVSIITALNHVAWNARRYIRGFLGMTTLCH
jgi:hypothetical protein